MSKEKFFRPYQTAWDKRHMKQFGTNRRPGSGQRASGPESRRISWCRICSWPGSRSRRTPLGPPCTMMGCISGGKCPSWTAAARHEPLSDAPPERPAL